MENNSPQQTIKGGDVTVSGGNAGPHGKGGDFTMIGGTIKGGDAVMSSPVENEKPTPLVQSFLEHPMTKWVFGIIGSLIAMYLAWKYGFN